LFSVHDRDRRLINKFKKKTKKNTKKWEAENAKMFKNMSKFNNSSNTTL